MISIKYRIGSNPAQTATLTQHAMPDERTLLSALFFTAGESVSPVLGFYVGQMFMTGDGRQIARCFLDTDHAPHDAHQATLGEPNTTITILKQTKSELGTHVDAFALLKKSISTETVSDYEQDYQKIIVGTSKIELHTQACLYVQSADTGVCTPTPSEWSRPITWDMVNRPNVSGWVSVSPNSAGSPNWGIDLSEHNTLRKFFGKVQQHFAHDCPIEMDYDGETSVRIRFVPEQGTGHVPHTTHHPQRGDFYVYSAHAVGTNGETTLCLADAFDSPPSVISCTFGRAVLMDDMILSVDGEVSEPIHVLE